MSRNTKTFDYQNVTVLHGLYLCRVARHAQRLTVSICNASNTFAAGRIRDSCSGICEVVVGHDAAAARRFVWVIDGHFPRLRRFNCHPPDLLFSTLLESGVLLLPST
eukprot:188252-Hanusia_phi.AAC.1